MMQTSTSPVAVQSQRNWNEERGFWDALRGDANDSLKALIFADYAAERGLFDLEAQLREYASELQNGWQGIGDYSSCYLVKVTPKESIAVRQLDQHILSEARTFAVGDVAEHGSYNLSYYGQIAAIGAKTVKIRDSIHGSNERPRFKVLKLSQFAWRNWDWSLERAQRRNNEWMD